MPGITTASTSISVTINGRPMAFQPGLTVLDALRQAHCDVPQLCHDDRIQPIGACRMCLVDIEGQSRPVASCHTPLADGMRIQSHTPEIEELRKTNLSLIARRYPAAAVSADPSHPFHRLLAEYGVSAGSSPSTDVFSDDSHPYLKLEMDRCIHCYRCVRICEELQGSDVWQVWGRGPETKVAPRGQLSLLAAGCVSCGACSDTCPTGAIVDRRERPAEHWTQSTCAYCGVGCQLNVGTANGEVVAIRPVRADVNKGHLCVKGRYAFDFNHAPDRMTTPMIRRDGAWQEVSWDEALGEVAERLRKISQRDGPGGGPQAIGMLGSARATNEENYYAQKFARIALGTNNIDCCARVCHTPSAAALYRMLGAGASTNSFDDVERAATIMIVGCNPTENHPIVGARIRQAVRRGTKLIVIDPRRTELAEIADHHLAVRPGGNIALINAMAAAIIENALEDREYLAARVDGFDVFRDSLANRPPEEVTSECGVPVNDIRRAAILYATHKPSMCLHGLGVTEHLQGTEGVMALINLALLTGNLGRAGAGINPLRGQNNVQGSAQMGCDPKTLTGGQKLDESHDRFEAIWGARLPTRHGLNLLEMMDAAREGKLSALWAIGYDVYLTLAHEKETARALANLELVIVQDLFLNKTAERFGHIFLPAASGFEKDGTFMNSDRRVQRVRAALRPRGQSKPDTWIIAEVARRLGFEKHFAHASEEAIWDEIRSVWPGGAGLAYSRMEQHPPHWPCLDESHPGTPILHESRFVKQARAELRPIVIVDSPEIVDDTFPFRLTTGRHLYQFNAGTMTQRTANVELRARDELEVSPADAALLGLATGDWVAIESRHGRCKMPIRIADRINPGELFTTFHDPESFVNRITSSVRDRLVDSPEYKFTAVKINKVPQENGP